MSEYHDRLAICADRYKVMAVDQPDLLPFVHEFDQGCRDHLPLMKLNRWVGYIQGLLIERGITTVEIERDFTRPLFRPLDFPEA